MTKSNQKQSTFFRLSWFFGVLLTFIGAILITQELLLGLLILTMGIALLPPFVNWLEKKHQFKLSPLHQGIVIFACFVLIGMVSEPSEDWTSNDRFVAEPVQEAVETIENTQTRIVEEGSFADLTTSLSLAEMRKEFGSPTEILEDYYMWEIDDLVIYQMYSGDELWFTDFRLENGYTRADVFASKIGLTNLEEYEPYIEHGEKIYKDIEGFSEINFAADYEGINPVYNENEVYSVTITLP
jgi:hypothetical protein